MRVRWSRSLTAKLFLLIGSCLLFTVAGISWQNSRMFRDFLNRQFEDQTISQAREATNNIESIVENWLSLTTFTMQDVSGRKKKDVQRLLQRFLASVKEFVAVEVVTRKGNVINHVAYEFNQEGDIRLEDRDLEKTSEAVRARTIEILGQDNLTSPQMFDLRDALKLPLMTLAVRFEGGASGEVWVMLTAWQTRLLKALSNTKLITSYLQTADGTIFGAFDRKEMAFHGPLLQSAASKQIVGYRSFSNNVDKNPVPYMGAFYKSKILDFTTLVVRDGTQAAKTIDKIIVRTALWAWVFFLGFLMVSFLAVDGVTKKLKDLTSTTLRLAQGDFSTRLIPKGGDEVSLLSHAVNHMSDQIQWFLKSQVEKARQEKELETAKMVQSTFFPKVAPQSSMLSISGKTIAASECGGDWWGHFPMRSGQEMIVIADVTGHGAPAALVTAMAYSGYQMIHKITESNDDLCLEPSQILRHMNEMLYEAGDGKTSMTCVLAIVDPESGAMRYVNAGHNAPYVIPQDSEDSRLVQRAAEGKRKRVITHRPLKGAGNPLGILKDWGDTEDQVTVLEPGDKILFYTDGVFECSNPEGKMWGPKRFRKTIDEFSQVSGDILKVKLFEKSFEHFSGQAPDDDITVVAVEVSAEWRPKLKKAG